MKPTKEIFRYIAYLIAFTVWIIPILILIAIQGG